MQTQENTANTHVTNKQGQQLSAIARDLGITRREFQSLKFFLENNLNPKPFFKQLKEKEDWFTRLEEQAGKHTFRVKVIYDLKVNYGMSFEKSMASLSDPWNDHHKDYLMKAANFYHEEGTGTKIETFILMSHIWGSRYCSSGELFNVIVKEITSQFKLHKTGPRAIFTIGTKIPKLADYLGVSSPSIFETMGSYPQGNRSNISYPYSCGVTFGKKISPCSICQASIVENTNHEDEEDWLVFRK